MTIALPVLAPGEAARAPGRAPAAARGAGRLVDSLGRVIRDLRLSITDRCNFRCVYCMEPGMQFMEAGSLLSEAELVRVAGVCASMGVEKVRLTGGEPTLHPGLEGIIRGVAGAAGVRDVALTTNGSRVDLPALERWRRAGLTRVTISIDAVDGGRFAAITRSRCEPERVTGAIEAAKAAGLGPKVNAVIIRGMNEGEIVPLARLARELGVEMRYIEYMPLDSGRAWDMGKLVPAAEVIGAIGAVYPLRAVGREEESSTSRIYEFADGAPGRIGIIAPVTQPFCGACSRLRVTADGKVRPCLFSREEWDLRPLLRGGAGDEQIREFLVDATWTKQAGHGISSPTFQQPDRPMSAIGG